MVSTEVLERPGTKAEDTKVAGDSLTQLGKGAVLMVCRTYGKKGDHWTSRCPYKDLTPQPEGFVDKPPGASEVTTVSAGATKSTYVPPGMRQGAGKTAGSNMRRRNDKNSVCHQPIRGHTGT